MKIQSLCVFLVLLTLFNCVLNSQTKDLFTGYFYLQKVYGGGDPLLVVKNSQQSMTLKYFSLNSKVLAYSKSQQNAKVVEGT